MTEDAFVFSVIFLGAFRRGNNPQFYWGKKKSFSNEKAASYMQAENSMV